MQNIEIKETGILCDNPNCDWKDESVKQEDLKGWINVPCPKCGDNVLTEQDYNNAQMFYEAMAMVNAMSKEDIYALNETISRDNILSSDLFKDAHGLENIKDRDADSIVRMTVNTHKEIKVTDIKRI